jgi:YihY family inner membrane protein
MIANACRFAIRTLRDFFLHNHGLLLAGAVAFNMMLSLVPLCVVMIVALSHVFDARLLLDSITAEAALISPGLASSLEHLLEDFLRQRKWIGWIGAVTLLSFSSLAFRVIEDAFAIIFHRPIPSFRRKFWRSMLMPYLFILILAAGLIVITAFNAILDSRGSLAEQLPLLQSLISRHVGTIAYAVSVAGLVLLFTLFYKILPVAHVPFRRALVGGCTAGLLWEVTRHLLVSYFNSRIPVVNFIYGSMTTLIIVLLTLEAAAIVLLLGAQVIANLGHHGTSDAKIDGSVARSTND